MILTQFKKERKLINKLTVKAHKQRVLCDDIHERLVKEIEKYKLSIV